MNNRIVGIAVALVVVFLAGFVPQYVRANRLDSELALSRSAYAGAELRDLAGLAFLQASQKNFGLAAETCGQFFNRVRDAATQAPNAGRRKGLEDLLAPRDHIVAGLAKGDPVVIGELQNLFIQTRAATREAGGQ